MYTQIFFVTSVRGIDFPPQIAANAGLRVFGAKSPTPFFFMAAAFFLPAAFFVAFKAFVVAFVSVAFFVVVTVVVVIAIEWIQVHARLRGRLRQRRLLRGRNRRRRHSDRVDT